jgi:predicted Zn-dependent protease
MRPSGGLSWRQGVDGTWPAWLLAGTLIAGCATPQYAIRPVPVPEESQAARQIEQAISELQGEQFDQQGARPIGPGERLWGVDIQRVVERLSRVTERPWLPYQAYLYQDPEPNAAALADGRIYLSSGMLDYLAGRGSRPDELAAVIGHELAHTVAQHLVKRYRTLQQQQLFMTALALGTAALARDAGASAQQAGRLALDAADLLRDVANSGYSQEQELEADQLGIRYMIQAGFDPRAALNMLQDFERFDTPWPFLRTHPYIALRREYLRRYLEETGPLESAHPALAPPHEPAVRTRAPALPQEALAERLSHLRQVQQLYPEGSVSWQNLQRQIEELERAARALVR